MKKLTQLSRLLAFEEDCWPVIFKTILSFYKKASFQHYDMFICATVLFPSQQCSMALKYLKLKLAFILVYFKVHEWTRRAVKCLVLVNSSQTHGFPVAHYIPLQQQQKPHHTWYTNHIFTQINDFWMQNTSIWSRSSKKKSSQWEDRFCVCSVSTEMTSTKVVHLEFSDKDVRNHITKVTHNQDLSRSWGSQGHHCS